MTVCRRLSVLLLTLSGVTALLGCSDTSHNSTSSSGVVRCVVAGTEGVSADRVATLQGVVDRLLRERLSTDYPLPPDVVEPAFAMLLATPGEDMPGTISLTGDPARERVAVREALCRAYLQRAVRDLPVHAWFRDGLILSLGADPEDGTGPPLRAEQKARMNEAAFMEWLGSARTISPGQTNAALIEGDHRRLSRSFFGYLVGHADPKLRGVPTRYYAEFASLATSSVRSSKQRGSGPADDILAEQRRQVPLRRALKRAFAPLDLLADVHKDWLGP